jgi:hypothetical protein
VETVCEPAEQRRRLEKRQLHDTRSDGRAELMERQRTDFEPPNSEHAELFERVATDGPVAETQRRVIELLKARGLLETEEIAALA